MKMTGYTQKEIDERNENERLENIKREREAAYRAESDPLFFKSQAGEIDAEVWRDKRKEIKKRFPK